MASSKFSNNDSLSFVAPILLILYLCIGFIPNWDAVDKIAPQWLIESADQMLYQAKKSGRNQLKYKLITINQTDAENEFID